MFFSIPQKLLADQLQIVSKAIPARSTISALEGVLFDSDGQTLTLSATNLEMGISTSCNVIHKEKGSVVLPGKIVEIIRRLPGESVQMKVNRENFLTEITSDQAEFQVYGLSAEEYPAMEAINPKEAAIYFEIRVKDLRRALRQTLFAVSHDEGKPAFCGVLFSLQEQTLTLASSDTFRLASASCPVLSNKNTGEFLVPAKNLQEVVRIFTDETAVIQVAVMKNQLNLSCEGIHFSSRLLDENFPNIERVIPKEFNGRATVETAALLQAIERASLLSEGNNHVVHLSIGSGTMVVRASSKYGKIQEKLPLTLSGEGIDIALNSRFLLDMLKITEGEECFIEITDSNKPCIIRDSLYANYLYLVLPIKI